MNNKKRSEILLKLIDEVYDQYQDAWNFINSSMVDICREKNVLTTPPSPWSGIFYFVWLFFGVIFIVIYDLVCLAVTDLNWKSCSWLYVSNVVRNSTKKQTPDVIKEELLDSLKERSNEKEPEQYSNWGYRDNLFIYFFL